MLILQSEFQRKRKEVTKSLQVDTKKKKIGDEKKINETIHKQN